MLQLSGLCCRAQEPQLLSPSATRLKPAHPRACAWKQEKPLRCREGYTQQLESSLHLPQLEKSPGSKEDSTQPKKKIIIIIIELHTFICTFSIYIEGKSLSCVRLLATPWTAAHQAPLSMGFVRQEYWSGAPLPSPSIYIMLLLKIFK